MTYGTTSLFVFTRLSAMSLGAINEITEFTPIVGLPNTNIGGPVNTAFDLVFNAVSGITAMVLLKFFARIAT